MIGSLIFAMVIAMLVVGAGASVLIVLIAMIAHGFHRAYHPR